MMTSRRNALGRAIALALLGSTLAGIAATAKADDQQSASLDRPISEHAGTRIAEAAAAPVYAITVFDREDLDASGATTLADFLRRTSLNTFGAIRPQSATTLQPLATASLRGLGQDRTLVLVDGRRLTMSPIVGAFQGQDLNAIPFAAIERIEVLPHGASALYGSDAVGGVINVITRKHFEGAEFSIGAGSPRRGGGETEEGSVIFGSSGERGSLVAGASYTTRGIIYQRERDYSSGGASTHSNNLLSAFPRPGTVNDYIVGGLISNPTYGSILPGFDCNSNGFFSTGTGANQRCFYDFTPLAADEAELHGRALFARGNFQINDDWATYLNADVSRSTSFGVLPPVPSFPWPGGAPIIPVGSPNHPALRFPNAGYNPGLPYFLRHRFAAVGPRTDSTEQNNYSLNVGISGRVGNFAVDAGLRHSEQQFYSLGRNAIVAGLVQQRISDGSYNLYDPFSTPRSILDSMTATVNRDAESQLQEIYANATTDLFEMGGGAAQLAFGAEYRSESYADIFDTLHSSGQIVGSAGTGSDGERDVRALHVEALLPITETLDVAVAGRYDDYSDYGSEFSPLVSLRFQALPSLTLRAHFGESFQAPAMGSLDLSSVRSSEFVFDTTYCGIAGLPICEPSFVDVYTIANPELQAEQSRHWGVGLDWQASSWLSLGIDYYDIAIDELIAPLSLFQIIRCANQTIDCPIGVRAFPANAVPGDPSLGLGVARSPSTGEILFIHRGLVNYGTQDTDGIDFKLSTEFELGNWGVLSNRLQLSRVGTFSDLGFDDIVDRPGYPEYRAYLATQWNLGDFSFDWIVNHIDGTLSTGGALTVDTGNDYGYVLRLPSWTTHDLQAAWNTPWNGKLALGVTNVADKGPPVDPQSARGGLPFDYQLYDGYGRVPYVRYTQGF